MSSPPTSDANWEVLASAGNQGLQGHQGNQGLQGHQGNQGDQGSGNQGLQGSQGAQGSAGGGGGTLPPIFATLGLTNGKFVSASIEGGTGTPLDLYTVPSGKRCMITGLFAANFSGGALTGTFGWSLYLNGAYQSMSAQTTNPANNISFSNIRGIVLEAGEKVAFNAPATGITGRFRGIEYDDTVLIFSPRIYAGSVASGYNTLYTCPSGYNASIISAAKPGSLECEFFSVFQASGGGISYTFHIVPSGGTPGTINRLQSPGSFLTNAVSGTTPTFQASGLSSGDFISVNSTSANATQVIWTTVCEVPN